MWYTLTERRRKKVAATTEMSVTELLEALDRSLMHSRREEAQALVRELDTRSLSEKEQGRLVVLKDRL